MPEWNLVKAAVVGATQGPPKMWKKSAAQSLFGELGIV